MTVTGGDLSLREWTLRHQEQVMSSLTWMGVPIRKSPLDVWMLQEILHEVRPEVVVEIGSWAGGSTLFYAHVLDLLGRGSVVSVDPDRSRWQGDHPRVTMLTGRSEDADIQARVAELCADRTVMVCHDGDHRRGAVEADLRDYAGLVSVGSYFVVEDGIVDLFPRGSALHPNKIDEGPLPAVRAFVESDARFEIDSERERFGVSWNPDGYLKRVV